MKRRNPAGWHVHYRQSAMAMGEAGTGAASALVSTQVTCMLPVKDMARARHFYEEPIGLMPLGTKPDGKFVYHCRGMPLTGP